MRLQPSSFRLIAAAFFWLTAMAWSAPVVIQGLDPERSEIVMAEVKPRLEFIDQRPATPYRANDAAYLVERELIREGFYEARVLSEIVAGGSTILLKVNSGPRYTVGNIRVQISGEQKVDTEEIESYFLQPIVDRELVRRDNIPFIENYRFEGAENVANYLKSRAYWKVEVEVSEPQFQRATKTVDFNLKVRTGQRHQMAMPRLIMPDNAPSAGELRSKLAEIEGKASTTERISFVRNTGTDYYRTQGFEFVKVSMEVDHRGGKTYTTLKLDPGRRFSIGEPSVVGLEKTVERRFLRPFKDLKGEEYNKEELDRVVSQLLQTGAFESIRVETAPGGDGELDLEITAREGKARGYNAYFGASSFQGAILGAGYYDRNFRGKLQNFSARAEINGLGLLGEIKLVEPFFLGENLALTSRLYVEEWAFEEYTKTETGIGFSLDHQFSPQSKILLFSEFSFNSISSTELPDSSLGQTSYAAATLGIEQKFDFRNNPALPTKGFFARGTASVTEVFGDNNTLVFGKVEASASYRLPVSDDFHLAAGVRGGAIYTPGGRSELPIDERFFIGGADSIRSYRWRDLGPRPLDSTSNRSQGGQAYWIANLEAEHQVAGPLWAVLFSDLGTLSRSADDLFSEDVEIALGLGLRLNLPIGPVRMEYAHNMTQDPGEPSGSWHFAIGVAF